MPYTDHAEPTPMSGKDAISQLGSDFPPAFRINYAEAKQVFTQNQFYTQDLNSSIQKLNDLSYRDYGLADHPTSTQSLQLSNKTPKKIAADFNTKKDKKGNLAYTDYHQRQLILTHDNFTKHITGEKYESEQRHLLYEKIQEVLQQPDEVYTSLHSTQQQAQYTYVKHYKDSNPLIVAAAIDNVAEPLQVKSWFLQYDNENKRKGILIKK